MSYFVGRLITFVINHPMCIVLLNSYTSCALFKTIISLRHIYATYLCIKYLKIYSYCCILWAHEIGTMICQCVKLWGDYGIWVTNWNCNSKTNCLHKLRYINTPHLSVQVIQIVGGKLVNITAYINKITTKPQKLCSLKVWQSRFVDDCWCLSWNSIVITFMVNETI